MQFWPQVAAAGLRVTEIPVRLIYNDPNRYFGGILDDADNRLRHYLDVLTTPNWSGGGSLREASRRTGAASAWTNRPTVLLLP